MPFLQCVGDLSSAFDNFVVNSVRKNIFFLPIIQFYLPINTNKPHFVVVLVFVGKAHSSLKCRLWKFLRNGTPY